jgi:DNA-binding transcriptional LysR family regulator
MNSGLDWQLYRSFLAAIKERSVSGAARELGISQPTMGRHLQSLEDAFGVTLFTRSQRGLELTPAALAILPHAQAMADAESALRRTGSAQANEERGTVRITASETIGTEVLPAAFTAFREAHPEIEVELLLSNRTHDLLGREADIAVRNVKPTQDALITRKLGSLHVGLYAHPRYVKARGVPRSLDKLREHPLVGFDAQPSIRNLPKLPITVSRELFSFRCDDEMAQYAAIRAGFGIGACQCAVANRDGLVRVLRDSFDFEFGVWLVMHRDLKSHRRVRLMFDHLVVHMQQHIAHQHER